MDHLHYRLTFDLDKSRQQFHQSLKERHKISNIPKFRHRIENRPEASLGQNYVRDFSCAGASQQV